MVLFAAAVVGGLSTGPSTARALTSDQAAVRQVVLVAFAAIGRHDANDYCRHVTATPYTPQHVPVAQKQCRKLINNGLRRHLVPRPRDVRVSRVRIRRRTASTLARWRANGRHHSSTQRLVKIRGYGWLIDLTDV